jgi:hypothetical protein
MRPLPRTPLFQGNSAAEIGRLRSVRATYMTIKLLVSLLAGASLIASLSGCALAPGPYLDTDRLDQTPSAESAEQGKVIYHVQPIDSTYFEHNPRPNIGSLESTCPLTCLNKNTRKLYAYQIGVNDQISVTVWDHPEFSSNGIALSTGTGGMPPLPVAPPGGDSGAAAGSAQANAAGAAASGAQVGGVTVRVANDGHHLFSACRSGTCYWRYRTGSAGEIDNVSCQDHSQPATRCPCDRFLQQAGAGYR